MSISKEHAASMLRASPQPRCCGHLTEIIIYYLTSKDVKKSLDRPRKFQKVEGPRGFMTIGT
jgi:hypothetical protein